MLPMLFRSTRAALDFSRTQRQVDAVLTSTTPARPAPAITGSRAMRCDDCDVTWSTPGGRRCFICGHPGKEC